MFASSLAIRPGLSLVVVSVLSNFLCDAGQNVDQSERLDTLNKVIRDHVGLLAQYARDNAASRFVIVPPLTRSVPDWFSAYLPGLSSLLLSEVISLSSTQLKCLSPFISPASYFDSDGVHLNPAAGLEFIKYIFAGVDQAYPVIDGLPQLDPPLHPFPATNLPQNPGLGELASAVKELASVTEKFQSEALTRREQDNLVFARLKEDRDYELNKSRENRFTVSGLQLKGSQVPPRDPVQRKEFFRVILQDLVDQACPDADPRPTVVDVYVNMRHGLGSPFIEGRMDSVASASAFRVAGSKLAKSEDDNFKGLFIANAVTLTTRVRIEILRALASNLTSPSQEAFVKGFSSRPVLCVKAKTQNPEDQSDVVAAPSDPGRNYTFCEAVEKWGHTLSQGNLVKAYRKARPAFNGCLEQYFVVLREFESEGSADIFDLLSGSNANPIGSAPVTRGSRPFTRARPRFPRVRGGRAETFSAVAGSSTSASTVPSASRPKRLLVDLVNSPSKIRK